MGLLLIIRITNKGLIFKYNRKKGFYEIHTADIIFTLLFLTI